MNILDRYSKYPYCIYPYSMSDKIIYHTNNVISKILRSLYGKNKYKEMYQIQKITANSEIHLDVVNDDTRIDIEYDALKYQLNDVNTKIVSTISHIAFISSFVLIPSCYFLRKSHYSDLQIKRILISTMSITASYVLYDLYYLITNMCKMLTYREKINKINHCLRVAYYVNTKFNGDNEYVSPISNFDEKIIQKKTEWITNTYYCNCKYQCQCNPVYIICNGYYENVYFIFNSQEFSQEFMNELCKLTIAEIDELSCDADKVRIIQQNFMRDKYYILMHQYHHNLGL